MPQGYFVAFFGKNYLLSEESLAKVDFWAPEASASNTTAMLSFLAKPPVRALCPRRGEILYGAPPVGSAALINCWLLCILQSMQQA